MLRVAVFLFLLKEFNCYHVLQPNGSVEVSPLGPRKPINGGLTPDSFDWREKNMVSPVKNQLHCAACWAFSTVANIESHLKIYSNIEVLLSEQFLIDCDEAEKGCGDAPILDTFAAIVTKFGGVLRDQDYYPYADRRMQCRWQKSISGELKLRHSVPPYQWSPQPVPVVGFRRVLPDEETMADFVYRYGPLSAAINSESMAVYKGGIDEPREENCSPKKLNHAVLIVGYHVYVSKTGAKLPYWIIKNSWGAGWGDNGFYYLVRGRNACGIASDVSFAYVN